MISGHRRLRAAKKAGLRKIPAIIKEMTNDEAVIAMVSDEERYITSGFHPQKHHPPYLPGILEYIQAYDWQKHLEAKSVAEPEPVVEIEVEEKPVVEKESFVKQFVAAVKRIFVKGR